MTASPRRAMRGMIPGGCTLEALTTAYCPAAVSLKRAVPGGPVPGARCQVAPVPARAVPGCPVSEPSLVERRFVGPAQVALGVDAPPLGHRQEPAVRRPAIRARRALVFDARPLQRHRAHVVADLPDRPQLPGAERSARADGGDGGQLG